MRRLLLILSLAGSGSAALAQEASLDRAELDLAAGRALFQPTPLAQSVASFEAKPAAAPASTGEPARNPPRRPVRVIYPGPYGR